MTERKLLALALMAAAGTLLPGHSPYLQWYAYRSRHLVVVADESRPGAVELATAIASALAARWPETKATPAAARSSTEVVRLLTSGQLQVGLIPPAAAVEAVEGGGPFKVDGRVPLRAVATVGEQVLVVLESYPSDRAGALAQALMEANASGPFKGKGVLQKAPIPLHPGAVRYYAEKTRPSH